MENLLYPIIDVDIVDETVTKEKEFVLNVSMTPGIIKDNFEPLKAELIKEMQQYQDLSVYQGDDALKDMKKSRAKLNNLVKDVKAEAKRQKDEYNKPVEEFDKRVKTFLEIIDEPKERLEKEIKNQEELLRKEQKVKIQAFYETYVSTTGLCMEAFKDELFDKIFSEKWLNSSTAQKTWKTAIQNAVTKYLENESLLVSMNEPDHFPDALKILQKTLDVSEAVAYINEKKKAAEEQERIRIQAEAQAKARMEQELARAKKEQEERLLREKQEELELEKQRMQSEFAVASRRPVSHPAARVQHNMDMPVQSMAEAVHGMDVSEYCTLRIKKADYEKAFAILTKYRIWFQSDLEKKVI